MKIIDGDVKTQHPRSRDANRGIRGIRDYKGNTGRAGSKGADLKVFLLADLI